MHISFTVPMWALVGFGSIAYPAVGALVASFLMRSSNRRLPSFVVALSGLLWPATLAAGVAVFPLWLATWFTSNYGEAIKRTLQGRMFQGGASSVTTEQAFTLGQAVRMAQAFGTLIPGNTGTVRNQSGKEVQVDFPGLGTFWVPSSTVYRA